MGKAHWTQHTHLLKKMIMNVLPAAQCTISPVLFVQTETRRWAKQSMIPCGLMKWQNMMRFLATVTTETGRKVKGGESSGKEKRRFIRRVV